MGLLGFSIGCIERCVICLVSNTGVRRGARARADLLGFLTSWGLGKVWSLFLVCIYAFMRVWPVGV